MVPWLHAQRSVTTEQITDPNHLPGSLQDCAIRQEIQGSLKQVQKLLSAHESSYLQSLRNLKKKINLMQGSATKQPPRGTNSKEKPLAPSALSHLFPINYSISAAGFFYRHLPKTGSTRQWEEAGQVPERWPRGPLPLPSWL